jgi:hypothetical protein
VEESKEPQLYRIGFRAWNFRTTASQRLEKSGRTAELGGNHDDTDCFAKR